MAQKEVEVTWKKFSRRLQEFEELSTDQSEHIASFDLGKPDSSVWLKEILKEATCGDQERRVVALCRFKNIFPGLLAEQGLAKGAECASYLLQRGFLKELQAGFPEARASGEWLLVSERATASGQIIVFLINRVAIYTSVVTAMMVDKITARFVLKEIKNLLKLLEATFHQAQHAPSVLQLSQGRFFALKPDPKTEARNSVIESVAGLVGLSNKAERFLAERRQFYMCMMREVVQISERSARGELGLTGTEHLAVTYSALRIVRRFYGCFPACEQESLPDDLRLVAQTLTESSRLPCIQTAVLILRTIVNLTTKRSSKSFSVTMASQKLSQPSQPARPTKILYGA